MRLVIMRECESECWCGAGDARIRQCFDVEMGLQD